MRRLSWVLVVAWAGCGGIGDGTTAPPVTDDLSMPITPTGDAGAMPAMLSTLYSSYFNQCAGCHAPNAPGATAGIETTLDFSTAATAFQTIKTGMAMGLVGNQAGCNGVAFVQPTSAQSLIVAVLDGVTRTNFDLLSAPSCDATAITDETAKLGAPPPAQFVDSLKKWVDSGAPNN